MSMIKNDLIRELNRTAEMLIDITDKQGIYFAIAFLYDSEYDKERIKALLPILFKKTRENNYIKK